MIVSVAYLFHIHMLNGLRPIFQRVGTPIGQSICSGGIIWTVILESGKLLIIRQWRVKNKRADISALFDAEGFSKRGSVSRM